MIALVFGAADGVWKEIEEAKKLTTFDIIVAVKRPGITYPGIIHHWVSFHPEFFDKWIEQRATLGFPPAEKYWASTYKGSAQVDYSYLPLNRIRCEGGSTGLIGVMVALAHASKVVLAGIPMMAEAGYFNKPGPWKEANKHRVAWENYFNDLNGRVKSMSGWTAMLLGEPTEKWLNS